MEIYKVGGAVRDHILGYPYSETDWVVVGATPQQLLDQGYTQVGRDFPVFLHPESKEEYALARTERKSGRGYHGFVVHADPSVTLEQDLERRDLTINAMAMTDDGQIIDPYGGQRDLLDRVLRHVSPHFVEDPLRVLRVARFAARYAHLGFTLAEETLALMSRIVIEGELDHLSKERIWVETERALAEPDPSAFFDVLAACGALNELLPAVAATTGVGFLERAARYTARTDCRWAALLSGLPAERATSTSQKLAAPNAYTLLASRVCRWRPALKSVLTSAEDTMRLLEALDALRKDEPFIGFCETNAALEGGIAAENEGCQRLSLSREAAKAVKAADLAATGLKGPALGEAIREARVQAIALLIGAQRKTDAEDAATSQQGG